ncbi:MAG: hypothetical protein ABJG68_09435 [Crocinitomicaceae bacterium]
MPKSINNNLTDLIHSLSKSEKRQFKLYTGRLPSNENTKYLELYHLIEKNRDITSQAIISKSSITNRQLSNVRQNLYEHLLKSLRLSPHLQTTPIKLREQLDFATILYNKGLYKQSLKILDKAKQLALGLDEKTMAYEIVEFEKVIESQFITRSLDSRADNLAISARDLSIQNVLTSKLSNLSLQIYSFLLKNGYAKNEDDYLKTRTYFHYHLPKYKNSHLGFREKLFLYMANLWYSLVIQDFLNGYRYATKWVDLFEDRPKMILAYPVHYLKGKNYLIESLFYLRYYSKFKQQLTELEAITENDKIIVNSNTQTLAFLYTRYNQLNQHFLTGNFVEGLAYASRIEQELKGYITKIDPHHLMVFYYKIASIYFGAVNYKACIFYLDKIVFNKQLGMRQDLLCYSRLLRLIAHYEDGQDDNLEELIRNTFKFLIKMDDLHQVQAEIIVFLRKLGDILPSELNQAFEDLHKNLKVLENHPYEKRSFLYLDIISWLESKITNKGIHLIIQAKAKKLK